LESHSSDDDRLQCCASDWLCTAGYLMRKLREFFEINDGFTFAALSLLIPIGIVVAIVIFA